MPSYPSCVQEPDSSLALGLASLSLLLGLCRQHPDVEPRWRGQRQLSLWKQRPGPQPAVAPPAQQRPPRGEVSASLEAGCAEQLSAQTRHDDDDDDDERQLKELAVCSRVPVRVSLCRRGP
eukprot:1948910-Rhodomonas_salina.2